MPSPYKARCRLSRSDADSLGKIEGNFNDMKSDNVIPTRVLTMREDDDVNTAEMYPLPMTRGNTRSHYWLPVLFTA